jgi:low temperature requirement protein LtrA
MQADDDAIVSTPGQPVGWLELFYDLVFVAAVITFSDAISSKPEIGQTAAVDGAFAAIWMIWLATTLHANRYRDDGAIHRGLVLVQMLLLTINALAVGDGFDAHPAVISVTYALLAFDVALMYARMVRGRDDEPGRFARARRNQYGAAALPIMVAAVVPEPARIVLWAVGLVLVAWPTLGFRAGRLGAVPPFDEHHLVERLGLLTILVCGESFVKVSLLAADGSLDGIDISVLVTMFGFVFAVWWAYFDDVPRAGIRPGAARAAGWLVGHLAVQVALVGSAVGFAKLLRYELTSTLGGDTSLLVTLPLVGVLLGLTLIGVCTRRVPQRGLVLLRLGVAALVGAMAIVTWRVDWINADGGGILAGVALGYSAVATLVLRRTRVEAAPDGSDPSPEASRVGYKGAE